MSQVNWEKFKEGLIMTIDAVNSSNVDCTCCPYYGLGICGDDTDKKNAICNMDEKQITDVINICEKNKKGGK